MMYDDFCFFQEVRTCIAISYVRKMLLKVLDSLIPPRPMLVKTAGLTMALWTPQTTRFDWLLK